MYIQCAQCNVHCTQYTIADAYCKILPNISRSLIIYDFIAVFCFIVDAKLLLCVANGIVTIDVLINRPMDLFLN